jgi:hypothetical protein
MEITIYLWYHLLMVCLLNILLHYQSSWMLSCPYKHKGAAAYLCLPVKIYEETKPCYLECKRTSEQVDVKYMRQLYLYFSSLMKLRWNDFVGTQFAYTCTSMCFGCIDEVNDIMYANVGSCMYAYKICCRQSSSCFSYHWYSLIGFCRVEVLYELPTPVKACSALRREGN